MLNILPVSVLIFFVTSSWAPANCDVIIPVQERPDGRFHNVSVSWKLFERFHSCLCEVSDSSCNVDHDDDYVAVSAQRSPGDEVNASKVNYQHVCSYNSSSQSIDCKLMATFNPALFPVQQKLKCPSTNITLYWSSNTGGIIFDNSDQCREYCASGCNCPDMTTPTPPSSPSTFVTIVTSIGTGIGATIVLIVACFCYFKFCATDDDIHVRHHHYTA